MWAAIGSFFAKLFAFFLIRQGGKDAERAKQAEETLETVERVNRPLSDPELQRVREKWRKP